MKSFEKSARPALILLGIILILVGLISEPQISRAQSEGGNDARLQISDIVPREGRAAGNTYLLISGSGFVEEGLEVHFNDEDSNGVKFVSEKELRVLTPAGTPGSRVSIKVLRADGASVVLNNAFHYQGLGSNIILFTGIAIVLMALLGLPLFLVIGGATAFGYYLSSIEEGVGFFVGLSYYGQARAGLGATIFNWVTDMGGKPLFIAIPLFTFAGSMMSESGSPTRLVNVARACVGWFPGGLAWVTLLVCCFFTAFTGASGVTIIALGGLLFPIMLKEGYGENYSLGLLTTGGSLGLLIPPSLPVIVYGIIAGLDADRIWDAGLGPMILIVLLLGGHAVWVATRAGVPRHPFALGELLAAIRAAAWELPLPFVVVLGIKGGFVTATEAAAVTAFWVLIVEVLIYRDITWNELPGVIKRSMILVGGLIVIIGLALAFTTWLTKNEVPQRILAVMQNNIDSQLTFLLMLNIFLLIVGCLMDIFSAILVVVPLIAPVAEGFGVDPFHLAIIFLVNLEIGYSTPPVGINLFISSLRFKRPVFQMYRASLVFIGVLLIGLVIITYWPGLTLGRFERPAVSILGTDSKPIAAPLTLPPDGNFTIQATLGGYDAQAAAALEDQAQTALVSRERELGISFEALERDLAAVKKGGTPASTKPVSELKSLRAALAPLARALQEARLRRVSIDSMESTARWRCRRHPDFESTGKSLDLADLEPGHYELTVTVQSTKKHLAQTAISLDIESQD